MTPIFIDSAYVIALINRRDQYHTQAQNLARLHKSAPLVVTDSVLIEIGNALARSYRAEATAVIEQFLSAPQVELVYLTPTLFTEAFELYKAYSDKQWSLVDCISFVVMQRRGMQRALTFDKHFAQAGFEIATTARG